jgi:hypothetical protein
MYSKNFSKPKPPTKQMIEFLMECHEREMMNLHPCEATETGAKGLIDRELLQTKYFVDGKGKRYLCVVITNEGRKYLQEIIEK